MFKKIRWRFVIPFLIVFGTLFFTRSHWQPWLFSVLFPRQQELEGIKLLVDLFNGILALATVDRWSCQVIIPHRQQSRKNLPPNSSLSPTTVEKILNTYTAESWQKIPWIDRSIVTTGDLRRCQVVILKGRMKSGKSREAAELIRRALAEEVILPAQLFDISAGMLEFSPDTLRSALEKKLDCASRALFYLNELPANATDKQLETLSEYLRMIRQCSPGYFVATLRSDHYENNPALQKWLKENDAALIEMKALTDDESSQLIDELLGIYPIELDQTSRRLLIDHSDGTPYHLLLTFQHLTEKGRKEISQDELKRIASQSMEEIWIEIRREIKKREPASESLLKALSVFYHANVTPNAALVLALAENFERSKNPWGNPWRRRAEEYCAPRNCCATMRLWFKIRAPFQMSRSKSLVPAAEARGKLESFLRRYRKAYRALRLQRSSTIARVQNVAFFELAVSYYLQNEILKAEHCLRWVVAVRSETCRAWCNLGVLLKQQGHTQEAVDAYRQAVAADPKYAKPGQPGGAA